MKRALWVLFAGAATALSLPAGAQTTDPASPPAATATSESAIAPVTALGGAGTPAETRIVNEFSAWSGSEDNARSLVTGLRHGGDMTLAASAPGGSTGTGAPGDATFTSPARPMGYGNVRIALALAREQLAQSGINDPTPAQIQAALVGGTIVNGTGGAGAMTEYPGVLQMRANGMGWGRIADSMGVKLGPVLSGRTAPTTPPASAQVASDTAAGGAGAAGTVSTANGAGTSAGAGITTAAGASAATVTARSRGNSAWARETHRPGAGIVTATGGHASRASVGARAHGGGSGAGVVTAAGASAGGSLSAAGRAHGKARAGR